MTVAYLGSLTVGEVFPAFAGMYAGILADLEAKLAGAASLAASLALHPPTLVANLALAGELVAALTAAIAVGDPGVDIQIAAVAAYIESLNVSIAALAGFEAAMGSAGVHAYTYDGTAAAFGDELAAQVGGGFPGGVASDHCNALILATTIPATWAAMGEIFIQ